MSNYDAISLWRVLLRVVQVVSNIAFLGFFAPFVFGPFPGWLTVFLVGLFAPVVFVFATLLLNWNRVVR